MNKERENARRIVDLIMEYYTYHEYSHINVDISIDEERTKIVVEGQVNPRDVDTRALERVFMNPRVSEYDHYYEGLMNTADMEEFKTIGYLMDDAYINLNGNTLLVKLYRNHLK